MVELLYQELHEFFRTWDRLLLMRATRNAQDAAEVDHHERNENRKAAGSFEQKNPLTERG